MEVSRPLPSCVLFSCGTYYFFMWPLLFLLAALEATCEWTLIISSVLTGGHQSCFQLCSDRAVSILVHCSIVMYDRFLKVKSLGQRIHTHTNIHTYTHFFVELHKEFCFWLGHSDIPVLSLYQKTYLTQLRTESTQTYLTEPRISQENA